MATRNIVPRATGEGSIGTSAKTWGAGYFDSIAANEMGSVTMTGAASWESGGKTAKVNAITNSFDIGWDYTNKEGAGISLRNTSHSENGAFNIWASDGNVRTFLTGTAAGGLTFNSKNVAFLTEIGYGYAQIADGNGHYVQVCWGAAQNATSAGITVTLPKAFPSGTTPRIIMSSMAGAYSCWATDITNTDFKAHSSTTGWASYIAIANV